MKIAAILVLLVSLRARSSERAQDPVLVKASETQWADHPFIKGARLAVQSGDPAKGPSVLLMKFPKGMTIPPHTHTSDETVTVVSGRAVLGQGESVDLSKGTEVGPGSYAFIPGKAPHWAVAQEDFVITVTLNRPADFHLCEKK
ncbi:MAG TPA: cupin domain-containing protein [Planctomycetota bacterium]|nr:cupin domain-containing protein [Planctomycetota bacterium]